LSILFENELNSLIKTFEEKSTNMDIEIESNEQPQESNNTTNNIEAGEDAMES
jgi:hypothetical protein